MKRFNGGSLVKGGYYLNTGSWELTTVGGAMDALPGEAADKFVHISLPLLFVLAPALGGAFAIFMPFLGFATVAYIVGKKLGGAGKRVVARLGARTHEAR